MDNKWRFQEFMVAHGMPCPRSTLLPDSSDLDRLALAAGTPVKAQPRVGGAYHLHGCLLKGMLWNPAYWSDIPLYNVRGLLQALTDPLPFIQRRWRT